MRDALHASPTINVRGNWPSFMRDALHASPTINVRGNWASFMRDALHASSKYIYILRAHAVLMGTPT